MLYVFYMLRLQKLCTFHPFSYHFSDNINPKEMSGTSNSYETSVLGNNWLAQYFHFAKLNGAALSLTSFIATFCRFVSLLWNCLLCRWNTSSGWILLQKHFKLHFIKPLAKNEQNAIIHDIKLIKSQNPQNDNNR